MTSVDFSGANPFDDSFFANRSKVALLACVVDVSVTDPHYAIALFGHTTAQLNFIAVIREVLVESASLLPQTTPYEVGETRHPGQIDDGGFLTLR